MSRKGLIMVSGFVFIAGHVLEIFSKNISTTIVLFVVCVVTILSIKDGLKYVKERFEKGNNY